MLVLKLFIGRVGYWIDSYHSFEFVSLFTRYSVWLLLFWNADRWWRRRVMQCFCANKPLIHWWYTIGQLQGCHQTKPIYSRRHRYVFCVLMCADIVNCGLLGNLSVIQCEHCMRNFHHWVHPSCIVWILFLLPVSRPNNFFVTLIQRRRDWWLFAKK